MAELGAYNAPASSVGQQGAAASPGGLCGEHSAVVNGSLSQQIMRAPLENSGSTLALSPPRELERGFNSLQCDFKKFRRKKEM